MRACLPMWSTCQRACIPAWFTSQRTCVLTCQKRAYFSFLRANMPINVPTCHNACQCFLDVPIFQAFLLRNAKGNLYTLLLYKKFDIILDTIVMYVICIYIVHKNCIIFHFYTSCHIKEKCVKFLLFETFLFFS